MLFVMQFSVKRSVYFFISGGRKTKMADCAHRGYWRLRSHVGWYGRWVVSWHHILLVEQSMFTHHTSHNACHHCTVIVSHPL